MTNFDLNDIFVKVFNDLFSYIGINHKFMTEVPASSLNSSDMVNTLIGISGDISGNVMFGHSDKTAKEIAAKIRGVSHDANIDEYTKAALADFYSEFCKRVIHSIRIENLFNSAGNEKDYALLSSNPTYIAGEDMYGVISKVPSKTLFFKVNGDKFGIAYNLE